MHRKIVWIHYKLVTIVGVEGGVFHFPFRHVFLFLPHQEDCGILVL